MARNNHAAPIALGGVLAALAVTIMCMGGLIPVATFLCPAACIMVMEIVRRKCGTRIGWAWYGCVALLALLLSPDKESAAVFVCLGYYPMIKPKLDRLRLPWLWKGLYFNAVILLMYQALMYIFSMKELAGEYAQLGTALTIALLLVGNVCFFLLDRVLTKRPRRKSRG